MRISDWSSDVCSSDLALARRRRVEKHDFKTLGSGLHQPLERRAQQQFLRIGRNAAHRNDGERIEAADGVGSLFNPPVEIARKAEAVIEAEQAVLARRTDRKSTRLNSSH